MIDLSPNAQLLLDEIKDRLNQNNSDSFCFIENIQSIAFGPLTGQDKLIPPSHVIRGQELQRLRQETALALDELAHHHLVLLQEQSQNHKTYTLPTDTTD